MCMDINDIILCITSHTVIYAHRETFKNSFSVNKESLESTSYLHKQDFVSVFLTRISTSRGLREVRNKIQTQAMYRD